MDVRGSRASSRVCLPLSSPRLTTIAPDLVTTPLRVTAAGRGASPTPTVDATPGASPPTRRVVGRHHVCVGAQSARRTHHRYLGPRPPVVGRRRKRRHADRWLRGATIARELHDIAAGSTTPEAVCDVEGVVDWSAGGPTDVTSLTELSRRFNRANAAGRWQPTCRTHGRAAALRTRPVRCRSGRPSCCARPVVAGVAVRVPVSRSGRCPRGAPGSRRSA